MWSLVRDSHLHLTPCRCSCQLFLSSSASAARQWATVAGLLVHVFASYHRRHSLPPHHKLKNRQKSARRLPSTGPTSATLAYSVNVAFLQLIQQRYYCRHIHDIHLLIIHRFLSWLIYLREECFCRRCRLTLRLPVRHWRLRWFLSCFIATYRPT